MTKRAGVGFIYFAVIVMTLVMRVASALDIYSALGVESDAFFTCMVQIMLFGVMSVVLYLLCVARPSAQTLKSVCIDFGVKKVSLRNCVRTVLLTVCMIVVASGISVVWNSVLSAMGYVRIPSSTDYTDYGVLFRELALVALLPAVFEEIAHRGLLYAGYRDSGWRFVLVSALLFSLMHQNITQTGYTFFDGAVIALAMYYTGSIFPGIFMHFVNNAYSVCSGFVSQNGGIFAFMNTVEEWLYGTVGGFIVSMCAVIICAFLIIFLFIRMREDAVKLGRVSATPFEKTDALPLHRDVFFISAVAVGTVATVFSLVWGMMR